MPQLVDCSRCLRLIDSREPECPFCGTRIRRAEFPGALLLGFVLGVTVAACNEKPDDKTTDDTPMTSGVAYAGPPPTSSGETGSDTTSTTSTSTSTSTGTTDPTSAGSAAAYAAAPPTEGTGATGGPVDDPSDADDGG